MTTAAGTHGRRVATRPATHGAQWMGAIALLGTSLLLALNAEAVISAEARLMAAAMGAFTFGQSAASDHFIYLGIGTDHVLGFLITPLCTSLVLATPVLILGGILLLFPQYRLSWVLRGVALALPLAVGANIVRFVLVGVALQLWGQGGFDIMHHYVGSVIVLLCSAAALVLLLLVSTTGKLAIPVRWRALLAGRRS